MPSLKYCSLLFMNFLLYFDPLLLFVTFEDLFAEYHFVQTVFEGCIMIGASFIFDALVYFAETLFEGVREAFCMAKWIGSQWSALRMDGGLSFFYMTDTVITDADVQTVDICTVPFGRLFITADQQVDGDGFTGNDLREECAAFSTPTIISLMISAGSSKRGLSDVTMVKSASLEDTSPISNRRTLERFPPHPNTMTIRFG